MNRQFPFLAGVTAIVIASAAALYGPSPAEARVQEPVASVATSSDQSHSFSDLDVFAFLATGTGAIPQKKPELDPGLRASKVEDSDKALRSALRNFRRVVPDFHEHIAVPLQSGDPYSTASALMVYNRGMAELANERGTSQQVVGDGRCVVVVVGALLVAVYAAVYLWPKALGNEKPELVIAADIAFAFRF